MSHPLGALAQNMTHLVRYEVGELAMESGLRLAGEKRWKEAVPMLEVGARAAAIFAKPGVCVEPQCAAYWCRVYEERRRLCADAAGRCTGSRAG